MAIETPCLRRNVQTGLAHVSYRQSTTATLVQTTRHRTRGSLDGNFGGKWILSCDCPKLLPQNDRMAPASRRSPRRKTTKGRQKGGNVAKNTRKGGKGKGAPVDKKKKDGKFDKSKCEL